MSRFNFAEEFEPYTRTSPVTHEKAVYLRVRHNRIKSQKLKGFLHCMHGHLEGHRYRTGNAEEDTREVRAALTEASHECSREVERQ